MSPVSPVSLNSARWLVALGVASLAVAFVVPTAMAEDDDRFERRGAIGVGYVYAASDYDHVPGQGGGNDGASGFTIRMTYRFNQWVASHARGDYVRGFDVRFLGDDVDADYGQGTIGVRVFPLAPLTEAFDDRVEPFLDATGGIGHVTRNFQGAVSDEKEYGFAARFAAGADIWLTDSIGVELGAFYNLGTGELYDYSYYGGTGAVTYRF